MGTLSKLEVSLSPAKNHSVRKSLDTLDSITYYQTEGEKTWHSIFKDKSCAMDVCHIVGVTTYQKLRFKCSHYFYLQSWQELLELNRAYKDAGLWYYHRDFLRSAKRILEDLAYSPTWCSYSIYYPKTLRPLLISPQSAFDDSQTTPVILVSPKLQGLDKITRQYLKEMEEERFEA
jgi:hypothetical protein